MSSYLKQIATDIQLAVAYNIERIQSRVAGRLLRELEAANARLARDNKHLANRNNSIQRALDGINKRGVDQALIVGRTQFGDITRDTATTFDTVHLPTLGVTIHVREGGLDLLHEDKSVVLNVHQYQQDENGNYGAISIVKD